MIKKIIKNFAAIIVDTIIFEIVYSKLKFGEANWLCLLTTLLIIYFIVLIQYKLKLIEL